MTGSKHTSKVKIGDNKDEIIQKFKEFQFSIHKNNTKKVYINIQKLFFIPLQNTIKNMRSELDNFEKNIISFKGELK